MQLFRERRFILCVIRIKKIPKRIFILTETQSADIFHMSLHYNHRSPCLKKSEKAFVIACEVYLCKLSFYLCGGCQSRYNCSKDESGSYSTVHCTVQYCIPFCDYDFQRPALNGNVKF